MEIKELLHKSLSERPFTNRIHSLLKRADARESADVKTLMETKNLIAL